MPDSTIGVQFAGSHGGSPVSLSGLAYRSNYFIGSDPSRWHEGVANYSRVGVRGIYPGIDTEFYEKNGELEHDFVLAPGADVKEIHLDLHSQRRATLTEAGDAVIPASNGELRFRKPVAYQFDAQGRRVAVDASYRLSGHNLRFEVGAYDRSRTLVIDPVIAFATYVAGTAGSTAAQLATATDTTTAHNVHLYVTGTVSSVLGFPSPGPTSVPSGITNTVTNVFVASLTASNLGGTIDWITFVGGNANSTASAIATSGAAGKVYVGGRTAATNFTAVGGYQGTFPKGGGPAGFVASLNATDGTHPASTYVVTVNPASASETDAANVTGLAVDGSGNVYASGYGPGLKLTQVKGLGITFAAPPAGGNNAFLIELNSTLTTASLATYVQGKNSADYRATGVMVDTTGIVYVSGTTSDSFPTAFAPTTTDYTGCTAQTSPSTNGFMAEIWPPSVSHNASTTASKFGLTAVLCGDGSTTAKGLALSPDNTNLYVVGDTTSTNLPANIFYSAVTSPASTTQSTTSGLTGLQATATAQHHGYALQILPLNGGSSSVLPAPQFKALAYLGAASGNTTFYSAAFDSTDSLLQLAGTTTAVRTDLPDEATATKLPSGQDSASGDAASMPQGLLYSLTDDLATADAITFFGAPVTQSTVKSVQSDGAGNTYALVDDNIPGTITNSAASFTSASAIQLQPPNGTAQHYAYVAEVQGTSVVAPSPLPGLTLTVDADSPSINGTSCTGQLACEIANDGTSTVTYTWDLILPNGEAHDLAFNFPEQDLLASPANPAYTIDVDGQAANSTSNNITFTCASKLSNNGTTCTLTSLAAASLSNPHKLTLKGTISSTASAGSTITFDGNVADAEGEYQDKPQTAVTVAKPVTITLALAQSTSTVDAANGAADTGSAGHTTEITYTATVKNTSANDSKFTTLHLTFPAGFSLISATSSIATGCQSDGSGCTQVDIPANSTLTYQVTGLYLASTVGSGTTAGPFTETVTAHASALPLTTGSQPTDQTVTTSVNGYAALTIAFTAVPTPPGGTGYPNAATAFNLGAGISASAGAPTPLTYAVKISNAGPNAVNNLPLANVLPQGWRPAATSPVTTSVAGGATANCTSSTACTLNLPLNGSATVTINGGFFDSATPDTAPIAAVSSTQASNNNITDHASLTVPAGTFNPNATTTTSTAITVQRLTHLVFALTSSGTPAVGVPAGTNYNLSNTNKVSYNYSIQNTGPDIAINVAVANTFTPAAYPAFQTSFVQQSTIPSGVTCAPATAPAFSNCTIASLAVNANVVALPYLFPDNPPGTTYPVSTEVSAVPIAASSAAYTYGTVYGTVALPAYGNSVDSNPTGTTNGDNKASTNFTIYRSNHLVLTLTNTGTLGESGGAYPTPGYDLGTQVTYAYKLVNEGPNYAINVPLANTLQITTPATYTVPPNAFSITAPTTGLAVCTAAPLYQNCGVASIAPSTGSPATFNVNVSYPDNPITLPTAQDVSAVPSAVNSALYTYNANLNNAYGNAIDTGAGPASDASSSSPTHLYRTANISVDTTTVPVSGPGPNCAAGASPCLYMVNSSNTQDTAIYTVNVKNSGPDQATQAQITYTLPNHFIVSPSVLAGVDQTKLPCSQTTGPNAELCKGFVPVGTTTATLTSQFDTTTVPNDLPNTDTNTPPNTPGSAQTAGQTGVVFAFGGTVAPINLPKVNVDRVTHLVTVKAVGPAPGDVSPSTVAAVNLDEKTAADAQGKNDLVQVTLQVGNAGLNDALSVSVTDPLPPFFILTQKPANCSVPNGTPVDSFGNPITGTASINLTCTIATVPAGTGTAGTSGHHGTVSGAFAQIVYGGKFQDNGLQTDIISLCSGGGSAQCKTSPNPQAIAVLLFGNAKAQSQDGLDLGDLSNAGDSTSTPALPLPIQRAAHLHFTVTQYVQPGDAALNPVGGVTGPGIAEAQLGANGGEVINPIRYQVQVTNDGPNIATDPIVSTTLPLNPGGGATKFVNVAQSIEPSSTPGFPTVPAGCTSGMACQDAGMIATGASILYNVDGNFDINTLTEGNSGARTFASVVASASVIDSNPTATAAGAQQTNLPITVVNTPAGANYTLAPMAGNLSQPVQLKLTTVQVAGITGLAVGGSTAPAVPMGVSPNPPDNGATVPLYRFGQGGIYYALGTTAGIPTATTNQTQICLNAIPDVFQKPERALLWALNNAPAGTAFNTVPHFTNTATEGDITTIVLPQGGGSYSVPVTSTSYPPPPAQPQPAMVCGVVNGLASAANPTVLAVLEPVNFAPFIRTAVTAANSTNSQPGKGVTAAAAQVDLTISPQNNYDYNDADPCYTGTGGATRSTCNDNVQLTTFLFGGGNLIGDAQQVHTYFYNDIQSTPKPQFNLPAGSPQLYLVLADQLGGQGYKEMTSGGNTQVCDPGNPSTAYTPTIPACPLSTPLQGTAPAVPPVQTQLPLSGDTSVEVALLIGNVGFGGSAGLIPLPQTATPEATAHVTAGQTAGFVWNWLTEQPVVQATGSGTPPVLTLACVSADGTDLAAKGITCNVQPTYTYSTGSGNTYALTAPPAVYVVTTGNTAVGAVHQGPLDRDLHIIAAVVFPIGAIPLVLLLRRRRALKLSGWLAVLFFASLVGASIGCGSNSSFNNQGGTTTTATPAGTYQFIVTATGTDSNGNPINIKTYPFAVTVSPVQ
ncbi:hypothetical protein [Alloacidobacterium sp.]|uniref:beta strand repeat-containing protein n=1 Tax=Alloacidobacterium sp. TaxID=2951999 RepID=UPI002D375DEF|nr:hypothetical protein [Alloacidobacterium sp.]HYK35039.1 hypothetical protein [Alloacidobacterium sp.]